MKPFLPLYVVYLATELVFAQIGWAQTDWLSTPESIDTFRNQVETIRPAESEYPLDQIEDRTVPLDGRDIRIRLYHPGGGGPRPALIYVHGACWVAGSLDSHDEVSRYLAVESGAMVIAVDYRLAPEHPYPAAHADVYDIASWLWDHSEELGIDRTRFAIGGESAGAHLAAGTALRAMDEPGGPDFSFLLLVYAALDGGGSSWTPCKNHYFTNAEDARSRYGSPLWVDDVGGMPPTFNIFGEYEISRAEEELFMMKLEEQGVETRSFMNEGVGHDVGTWGSVRGDLTAHEVAIEYISAGFAVAN
jgi:acetyl esterase